MAVERRGSRPAEPAPSPAPLDDTAVRSLSKEDRAKLGMDAWEPSLLRELLAAHNKLKDDKKS
jgi:hypothetical protein